MSARRDAFGDAVDIAHVQLAAAQGLAALESAGLLGAAARARTGAGRWRSARP